MDKKEQLRRSIKNVIRYRHGNIKEFTNATGLSNQSLNNILSGNRTTFDNVYKLSIGLGWEEKSIAEINKTIYSLKNS